MPFFIRIFSALLLILSFSSLAEEKPQTVLLVSTQGFAPAVRIYKHLFDRFRTLNIQSQLVFLHNLTLEEANKHDLIISIGRHSFPEVIKQGSLSPVLGLYVDKKLYRQLRYANPQTRMSAIFFEPLMTKQMLLARNIFPKLKKPGILLSPDQAHETQLIRDYAKQLGLQPVIGVHREGENLIINLLRVLDESDYILGVYDSNIYNRNTARSILLSLYRNKKVLIGPTDTYVQAGSIASLYASQESLAQQTFETIKYFYAQKSLPPASYTQQYSLLVNDQVARSLNIWLPSDKDLLKGIN